MPTESRWCKTLQASFLRRGDCCHKLTCDLKMHCIFPPTLEGYLCNKETWLNTAIFNYGISEGFHACEDTCCCTDLEDAYNGVSFDYLMQTQQRDEVYPLFIRWLVAALLQRKVTLRWAVVFKSDNNLSWTATKFSTITSLNQCVTLWQLLVNNLIEKEGCCHLLMTILCMDRKKKMRSPTPCKVNLITSLPGVMFQQPLSNQQKQQLHGSHWTITMSIRISHVVDYGSEWPESTSWHTWEWSLIIACVLWHMLTV